MSSICLKQEEGQAESFGFYVVELEISVKFVTLAGYCQDLDEKFGLGFNLPTRLFQIGILVKKRSRIGLQFRCYVSPDNPCQTDISLDEGAGLVEYPTPFGVPLCSFDLERDMVCPIANKLFRSIKLSIQEGRLKFFFMHD